jgi:hypothetical protein
VDESQAKKRNPARRPGQIIFVIGVYGFNMRPGCWSLTSLAFAVIEARQPIVIVMNSLCYLLILLLMFSSSYGD